MTGRLADSGSWSLGFLIGLPIFAVTVVALVLFTVVMARLAWVDRGTGDTGDLSWFIGAGVAALAVAVGFAAFGFYPYSAEYHRWREVTGTVERIDQRLIRSGDAMEDKFVVRYAESGMQFSCDDTRCAQIDPGQVLTLTCKRAWQYTGTDGYDCRFVEVAS